MPISKLKQLTFEHIQFLLEVERTQIMTKAGSVFGMSASKASRTMMKIEEILGMSCFTSVRGKLVPTEYFEKIRPILVQLLQLSVKLIPEEFKPFVCEKTFRISCMMTEVAHIIGGVLPVVLNDAPKVRLHLSKEKNELAAVLDGLVDFAIVTDVNLPLDLHRLRLYPADRVVLLRKRHPLALLNRPLQMQDLKSYPRVTITTGRTNSWTGPDQDLFLYERYMERTSFSTSRFQAAWEAMEQTDLIGICGCRAAEIAMRGHEMTALPLPEDANEKNYWNVLVWSELTHRDPACIWLRGIFANWAEREEQRISKLMQEGKIPQRRPPVV